MAVETTSVACNHCGATLDIGEDTKFVTCTYCDTKLVVRREKGALFTEVQKAVARLEKRAAKIEGDVDVLKLEAELARVERDWEQHREPLMNRSKDGRLTVPSRGVAIFIMALGCLFGVIAALTDAGPLIGALCAAAGVVFGLMHHSQASRYERALRTYEERRDGIEVRLRKARKRDRDPED